MAAGAGIQASVLATPLLQSYSCFQGVPPFPTSISMNTQEQMTRVSSDFAEEHLLLTSIV